MDSYYASTANVRPSGSMLQSKEVADICIIGAGYTGLSSALHLALKGYSVIVLEAETIAFGASGRNGGHVGIGQRADQELSLIHISEPTRPLYISYAVFCLKKIVF